MRPESQSSNPHTLKSTGKSRVLIVDDHPLVRHGMAQLINQEADLHICCEAGNAEEAMEATCNCTHDLAIVDISMEGISGIELVKALKAKNGNLPVLVISMHDESLYAERALRAGAKGYVMKQEAPETILTAIRQILRGNIHVSDRIRDKMLRQITEGPQADASPLDKLGDRELEVIQLIGQGFRTVEIAERLNRSIKTIEAHRANLKKKLALKNGAELLHFAVQWTTRSGTAGPDGPGE
ncbi:MAG TPA: response regulator transcription factor [Sulfuricella sp.]|nr:response regulator transcription factor [Sulfuricella sp.]